MPLWDLDTSSLLDAMPDAVLLVNSQGRILTANSQAGSMFDYSPEELIGQSIDILIPANSRTLHGQHITSFFATPGIRPMGLGMDLRAVRRDGTEFPVDISLSFLIGNSETVAVASIRDVSDREHLAATLRLSEEKYRLLVENASEVFYRMTVGDDPFRGRIEFVSGQCESLMGRRSEEFLSNSSLWIESIHKEDLPLLAESTKQILSTGKDGTRVYRILCARRNEYRWVEDRVTPLVDSHGAVAGYQGVARDITESRQLAEEREKLEAQLQQAQKMEAVGRLAGGIAHDFNNYLTIMLGNCDMVLADLNTDHPSHKKLRQVLDAGTRSAQLTRQLLAFARKQPIAPRILDLNASLQAMESLLRRTVGEDILIDLLTEPRLWRVHLDSSQLDQIVMNLVVNARDAMPDGGRIVITTQNATLTPDFCATHPGSTPGEYVSLTVKDTGVGMDEATQRNAFEPFFTTKPVGQGTGLGLATIYGIVKQNHGYVDLRSALERGTIIRVYIPRCADEQPAHFDNKLAPSSRKGGETILIVEDNVQLRELVGRLLIRLGYKILEANGPEDALLKCAGHDGEIQLLLTDVVMPETNGFELARRIAKLRPGIQTIFMSGYAQHELSRYGAFSPDVHLIQKPFTPDELDKAIRTALTR
jgi:PAS domain S-box-containing protein